MISINLILNILQKNKAIDLKVFNKAFSNIEKEYIIVLTGISIIHVKSISNKLILCIKKNFNIKNCTISGINTNWVIVCVENITIHVMSKESREYYDLDSKLDNLEEC